MWNNSFSDLMNGGYKGWGNGIGSVYCVLKELNGVYDEKYEGGCLRGSVSDVFEGEFDELGFLDVCGGKVNRYSMEIELMFLIDSGDLYEEWCIGYWDGNMKGVCKWC